MCVACNEYVFVCVLHIYTSACGWGNMDMEHGAVQPHLYEAAEFGSPNTVLPAA